jgi:hypothetical protein
MWLNLMMDATQSSKGQVVWNSWQVELKENVYFC